MSERATFDLAARLRAPEGAPLGEVFSFMSGLYFRGKLAYGRAFACAPDGVELDGGGVFVITPNAGLRSPDTVRDARCDPRIRRRGRLGRQPAIPPCRSSAARARWPPRSATARSCCSAASRPRNTWTCCSTSSATACSSREEFVGRGDMSRGGLLLRCVAPGEELTYVPVAGAVRNGSRPPKLDPATRPKP